MALTLLFLPVGPLYMNINFETESTETKHNDDPQGDDLRKLW